MSVEEREFSGYFVLIIVFYMIIFIAVAFLGFPFFEIENFFAPLSPAVKNAMNIGCGSDCFMARGLSVGYVLFPLVVFCFMPKNVLQAACHEFLEKKRRLKDGLSKKTSWKTIWLIAIIGHFLFTAMLVYILWFDFGYPDESRETTRRTSMLKDMYFDRPSMVFMATLSFVGLTGFAIHVRGYLFYPFYREKFEEEWVWSDF